jgi:hypothetical protein
MVVEGKKRPIVDNEKTVTMIDFQNLSISDPSFALFGLDAK